MNKRCLNPGEDDPSPYSVFHSFFNSNKLKKPTKVFIPLQLWGEFPEAAKQMIIDYNQKIKVATPRPRFQCWQNQTKIYCGTI